VPQVLSSKCVSELVEEEVLAVRSLGALIAMLRNALSAIQFRTVSKGSRKAGFSAIVSALALIIL
jgi:predicted transcriptional regulator